MKPSALRVVATAALAVLVISAGTATAATASADTSAPDPGTPRVVTDPIAPVPSVSPTGTYVVLLDEAPAALYTGGVDGYPATAPAPGDRLDAGATRVSRYISHLQQRQSETAEVAGVEILAGYHSVLNGFSARLSPEQLAVVAASAGVREIVPDEILRPDAAAEAAAPLAAPPAAAPRATAEPAGAVDADAVVIGIIDTGIVSGNPSLPTSKVIDAQVFAAGATAAGVDIGRDSAAPTDRSGHGSAMAGIAAGNPVDVGLGGRAAEEVVGAAPDALVASYKACFAGEEPATTVDDLCVASDVLAALDAAVADGVDVLTLALSRTSGPGPWALGDLALFGAATAGVFAAVSAGNSGPAATSTAGGASWYATVGASTTAAHAATVRLDSGLALAGVSASLSDDVTAPLVVAAEGGLQGEQEARLCYPDSLDPALVAGAVVVCERGTNAREEKARAVAAAGGVGMILVNTAPDSLDPAFDILPTVQMDAGEWALLRSALAEETAPTVTLEAGEAPTGGVPAPQVAGFSGRGPGVDGVGPDVIAPGIGIVAPTRDGSGGRAHWTVFSGTSMATAHVAGLAARYLAENPAATPGEVKSALMTTAVDAVGPDASPLVDPFVQGAGLVDADRFLEPGLLYLGTPSAGRARLSGYPGIGDADADIPPGDAPIVVPRLSRSHTETRTVTATRAQTYRAVASVPGIEVTVTPAELAFGSAGDMREFTVEVSAGEAPPGVWATGYLTWIGEDGTTSVRSPLAVRPTTAGAEEVVAGEGTDGTATLAAAATTDPQVIGPAPVQLLVDPDVPAPGHSGDAGSGDANGRIAWIVPVQDGAALAEFALSASRTAEPELTVYRLAEPAGTAPAQTYVARWGSAATEEGRVVRIDDPSPGEYLVVVDVDRDAEDATWDLTSVVVAAGGPSATVVDAAGSSAVSWSGLMPDRAYVAVIGYPAIADRTLLRIDTGPDGAVLRTPPALSGDAAVGGVLTVDPGQWSPANAVVAVQWLKDGAPIPGADGRTYFVRESDAGSSLSARVQARRPGGINAGTAVTDAVTIVVGSRVQARMNRSTGTTTDDFRVTVTADTDPGQPARGSVTITVAGRDYVGTLVGGRVAFAVPNPGPGIHEVLVRYAGTAVVGASSTTVEFTVEE